MVVEARGTALAACHHRMARLERLLVDAMLEREEGRRLLAVAEKDLADAIRRQDAAERLAAVAAGNALAETVQPYTRQRAREVADRLIASVEEFLESGQTLMNPLRPQFVEWRSLLHWTLRVRDHLAVDAVSVAEDLLRVLSVLSAGQAFPEMLAFREASEELVALRLVERARDGAEEGAA